MDNMFASIRLALTASDPLAMKNPVLIHGIIQTYGRGIPPVLKQGKKKGRAAKAKARGTVKAAVLKGDPHSSDLIIGSC